MSVVEKVAVFIDGNDFYHGLIRNFEKVNLDYYKLGKKLSATRNLIRIYYYNVPLNQNDDKNKYQEQQKFFSALDRTEHLKVKLGKTKNEAVVKLIVDMIIYARAQGMYDTAILVSSDGVFVPAVEAVQDNGKTLEHAYFNDGADALKTASDKTIAITDEILNECIFVK